MEVGNAASAALTAFAGAVAGFTAVTSGILLYQATRWRPCPGYSYMPLNRHGSIDVRLSPFNLKLLLSSSLKLTRPNVTPSSLTGRSEPGRRRR